MSLYSGSDMVQSDTDLDAMRRLRRRAARTPTPEPEPEPDEESEEDDGDVDMDNDADELQDEDAEGEEDDEEGMDSVEEEVSPVKPPPRLKIKLKLPANPSSTSTTPAAEEPPPKPRRGRNKPKVEVESEDSSDFDNASKQPMRPLTARQAAMANQSSTTNLVALDMEEGSKSKKKQLTESEVALRREETARKRKNLTEKKLEDEKAETINRLLKKQTRPRNKRNNTSASIRQAEDRTPNDDEEDPENETPPAPAPLPTMYRWISTSRAPGQESDDTQEKKMFLSFSVPVNALPASETTSNGDVKMEVDSEAPPPKERPKCDVDGCRAERKYRLVKDFARGACGMVHLRVLEGR